MTVLRNELGHFLPGTDPGPGRSRIRSRDDQTYEELVKIAKGFNPLEMIEIEKRARAQAIKANLDEETAVQQVFQEWFTVQMEARYALQRLLAQKQSQAD